MNELMVTGWIYYPTNKATAEEAYDELCDKLESIGVNCDNLTQEIVLRDEDYCDIDTYEMF
jgi:hypothetical protein